MERNQALQQTEYCVPAGRLLRLLRSRGWTLHCVAGTLLITQEGDARDHTLRAGEQAAIDSHGRVLVEAVGSATQGARLRLVRTAPAGLVPGRPVVELVKPSPARIGTHPASLQPHCHPPGTLTTGHVFRDPRLLEQLVREAHRERNALIGTVVAATIARGMRLVTGAGRMALTGATAVARLIAGLRPRLPTLQETFAARVFLRSRL